ncbi:hypothetical protein J1N35_011299 [Gossypium stocksii]|uniref:Transposase MuDR plant domain-containing protein n=1 Tax=Gossypium stocksii TaxID=47602 RepID=A0A9D3W208_9ROSI|nr:hypothetical protein J1N35_011299 [Gossypium stocksii]
MSERINAVIYYDVDPVTYDSFDIKGARSLEAIVQTYLASGSPYLELYVQFSLPNEAFATSTSITIQEEYMTPTRHSVSGWQNTKAPVFGSSMEYTTPTRHSVSGWDMHLSGSMFDAGNTYWRMTSTSSGWQSTFDWGCYETSIRRDDVLLTTSTSEGTSYFANDCGSDDESDVDPPREPDLDSAEVVLFSEPEPVLTEPEDVERGSDEKEEYPRFRACSPQTHMHNADLSADDALEFPDLPHRRRDRTSSSLDSGELEVGKEFSNKDNFLGALKQNNIINGVNYNIVKSKSDKFEAKCAVQDGTCLWKIMTSAWIARQKALENMYSGWDASYNEVQQWCQVLERYVPSCITDLETTPAYYNDRLLLGCQVFKRLF